MTAEQINVITGLGADDLIEVFGDLREGDKVATRGAERLSNGMSVSIVQDNSGASTTASSTVN
jgi:hypothetical protein